jgi:SAM-dependent methyltransferase
MKKILELGCGQGYHALILSQRHRVIGIDISKSDLLVAAKRYPRLTLLAMSGPALGFKSQVFDAVYALDMLEHVDNLVSTIGEIRRCLKVGGEVIANIPYWKSENWLLGLRPSFHNEIHHLRIFGENELESIMERFNFKTIEKKRRGFLSHLELLIQFKSKQKSRSQLGIGNWRDNIWTAALHLGLLYFNPLVLKTPLRYFPVWLITLPIGMLIDFLGNKKFPKSLFYRFLLENSDGEEKG